VNPSARCRTLVRGAGLTGGEGGRRLVTRGSLGTGTRVAGTRPAVQGSGLCRWTLDALVRVGGWAEAVEGKGRRHRQGR
jgi:hypothetical protein